MARIRSFVDSLLRPKRFSLRQKTTELDNLTITVTVPNSEKNFINRVISPQTDDDDDDFYDCSDMNVSDEIPSPIPVEKFGFKKRNVVMDADGKLSISCTKDMGDATSVSSVCTSVMGSQVDDLENVYLKHRNSVFNKDGFISTPLHIVKMLTAEWKKKLEIDHYVLKQPGQSNIIYRVDIMIEKMRGVGQCTRKQLARQLAAIDLLEKLQQSEYGDRPSLKQKYALLPGWRVNAMVYKAFRDVCQGMDLPSPRFYVGQPPHDKLGKCKVTCRVGNHVTFGEHDFPWLAKKIAAKEMYEQLTGSLYPVEATLTGNEVLGFSEMKLLGFIPELTVKKRKWLTDYRVENTQVVIPSNEPNDGDMSEVEAEVKRLESSKKIKPCDFKEVLKITINETPSSYSPTCSETSTETVIQRGPIETHREAQSVEKKAKINPEDYNIDFNDSFDDNDYEFQIKIDEDEEDWFLNH